MRNIARNGLWDLSTTQGQKALNAEKKMARTSLALLCAMLTFWTPYTIVAFRCTFGDPNNIPMIVHCITPCFAKFQAVADPFLYVSTNKRFRIAFWELMPGFVVGRCLDNDLADDDESGDQRGNKVAPQVSQGLSDISSSKNG
uniref:Xenopsin 2 n=1 Tax=Spadella cephaloptera TaxID=52888 RepID=A0A9E8MBR4_9BILA|nr:xenopsin 2 [Spadella cephaloptera]